VDFITKVLRVRGGGGGGSEKGGCCCAQTLRGHWGAREEEGGREKGGRGSVKSKIREKGVREVSQESWKSFFNTRSCVAGDSRVHKHLCV
jgi:hypothetical protein